MPTRTERAIALAEILKPIAETMTIAEVEAYAAQRGLTCSRSDASGTSEIVLSRMDHHAAAQVRDGRVLVEDVRMATESIRRALRPSLRLDDISQADLLRCALMEHRDAVTSICVLAGASAAEIGDVAVDERLWKSATADERLEMLQRWLDIEALYALTPDVPIALRKGPSDAPLGGRR